MVTLNRILVIALLATLATAVTAELETIIEKNVVASNPAEAAVLTQLKIQRSGSVDASYNYKCTVGQFTSTRVACSAGDTASWSLPHDVELKLRCPSSGSGLTLTYMEFSFEVSSQSVNCFVHEGAVGMGYMGITIQAWNTLLFNFTGRFYS